MRSLAHVEQQVRDYFDTIEPEADHSAVHVSLGADQKDIAALMGVTRTRVQQLGKEKRQDSAPS